MFTIKKYDPSTQVKRTIWEKLYQWRNPLSIALGTLVVVLGGWFVVYPRYVVLADIEKKIIEEKERNAKLDGVLERLRTFITNYEEFKAQSDITVFDALLPQSMDIVQIFSDIHYFSKAAHIDPKSIAIATDKAANTKAVSSIPGVQSLNINVSFLHPPTYTNFKTLLGMLEKSIPLYDIDKITIDAGSLEESDPRVTSFVIKTYYYPGAVVTKPVVQ